MESGRSPEACVLGEAQVAYRKMATGLRQVALCQCRIARQAQ
jgi:hypothetical protein